MSTTDISCNCRWDASENITYCCPKPMICEEGKDCCKNCHLQWTNRDVVECRGQNQMSNKMFNTPYYFMQNNPNNCCKGQFKYIIKNGKTKGVVNYKSRAFGENNISYPRNQVGRWNQSTTNTKLFPVISVGQVRNVSITYSDEYNCDGKRLIKNKKYSNPTAFTVQKQSGRLFKNTHPNMSKRQLYAYLSRNRRFLNR